MSTSATSYQWFLNGDLIAGATSQSYTPTQNGVYVVKTTDSNGCVYVYSQGFKITSFLPTLQKENVAAGSFEVYPNPAEGIFNLRVNSEENYTVNVYTLNGKLVHSEKNARQLDLAHLNAGMYFMTITTEKNQTVTKKIAIIK